MARYPYTTIASDPGTLLPRLPMTITRGIRSIRVAGIVDSAATVNVIPYHMGRSLGANWHEQQDLGPLAGGLQGVDSRALAVNCEIPEITGATGIPLLFAWASTDSVSVLLGQTNFLMEFNACFYRSQNYFEVWRA